MPIIAFPSSLVETATFELLGEDHAFYAEAVSPESMAKVMGSVLQMTPEEYEKIRYNNHQFASQHFTWTALARQLQQSIS
jgi:glycosyltransferase involved in cell wall biosynthesis